MNRLKVACYYPWVYLQSGVERTILEFCQRSRHKYTIFTNHFEADATFPEFRTLNVVVLSDVPVQRNLFSVLQAAATIATQKLDLAGYDALLVHCEGLGDLAMNRASPIPAACFCHTPLRPVFDPEYRLRAAQRYPGIGSRLMFNLFSAGFRKIDQRMWSRYRYVFFNSEESRGRAERGGLLRSLNSRHEVLHPGIDWCELRPTWTYERYFLVAGRIMWTKNVELAIEAFAQFVQLSSDYSDFRLVIAGHVDEKSKKYLANLREAAAGLSQIEFIVSPSDEVLHRLYANCYALLFPPFNEDWGIVPLEANAFGKPVIATAFGGPKESQHDAETGFLVPPQADAFAAAMARLANDEQLVRQFGRTARAQAHQWDWSSVVRRADDILEAIASGSNTYNRHL
jgi:glycosyltransferase involved in cell wall biosynthesis